MNLLPPRPDDEALRGEKIVSGGRDGAIDFAVTSGLRNDVIGAAAQDPTVVWARYEDFKRQHLRTQAQCNDRNLDFLPFIIEADGGGLGPVARKVCASIAQTGAARDGEEGSTRAASLLRRITTTVHRENARAMLRRLPVQMSVPVSSSPAAWDSRTRAWGPLKMVP